MSGTEQKKQVGIVLVTHGNYGQSLLDAAQSILGRQPGCGAVGVDISLEVGEILANIREAVQKSDLGGGVLILTDMFGGTPTNLSLSLLGTGKLEVMTGVNLPMLVKLARIRADFDIKKAVAAASEAGRKYINVASETLGG